MQSPMPIPQGPASEIETALSFRDEIIRRADEFESERHLPDDLVPRLAESRLFAAALPQEYGGTARSPREMFETIEAMAYADASAGWCTMIYLITGLLGGYLSKRGADEVFHKPTVLICGATAPSGKARRVDGGFIVDGHWKWGSGSRHADWICGGVLVSDGDQPRRLPSGDLEVHIMVFPRAEVEIVDTWHPFGMRGTGSNDFKVSQVFVPDHRAFVLGATEPRAREDIFRFPFFSIFGVGVAAVPLGVARRAADEFREIAGSKIPMWRSRSIAERGGVQSVAAEAEAMIRSGRAYLMESLDESWTALRRDGSVAGEDRVHHRLAAAHATHSAVKAVNMLYTAAGGTAIHRECQLQRCLRDVHVTTQHMMVNPTVFEQTGLYLLRGGPYSNML